MSLVIELTNGLEDKVRNEAEKRGLSADECARRLVVESLSRGRHPLSEAIQSWIGEGDEQEQRETYEALAKGLSENPVRFREIVL
jgi:hypothetical protein